LSGVVLDGHSDTPLPEVTVLLTGRAGNEVVVSAKQVTDQQGRFVFEDLPAAVFEVRVSSPEFTARDLGADGRSSRVYRSLSAGQFMENVRAWLWPNGSIQGRVLDEDGEPLVRTPVRAVARVSIGGRLRHIASHEAVTDDRGQYRLANLPAGTYLVLRTPGHFEEPATYVYPSTYYPGARESAQALPVVLQPGEHRVDVDIRLERMATGRIEGHLEGPLDGLVGARLRLVHRIGIDLGLGYEAATAVIGPDGAFAFPPVPAGAYRIEALPSTAVIGLGTAPEQYAARKAAAVPYPDMYGTGRSVQADVRQIALSSTVGDLTMQSYARSVGGWVRSDVESKAGHVETVVLEVRPTVSLSGQVVRESVASDPSKKAAPLAVFLTAEPADPSHGLPKTVMDLRTRNEFSIKGLLPGEYYLTYALRAIKSIQWNGREYVDRPFDASGGADFRDVIVTLSETVQKLSGTVRDRKGTPVPFGTVLVFPADASLWTSFGVAPHRLGMVRADAQGAFQVTTLRPFLVLPAGDYMLAAPSRVPDDWMDPVFLEGLVAGAERVHVNWGDAKSVDLSVLDVMVP
jgi:hypothetical protein